MAVFRMPSLGADMEAGTLVEWLKKPGDRLARGDIVAVVETQKGAIEVETFDEGMLTKLLVGPGETVPVGTPLAEIAGEGAVPAEAEKKEPAMPGPVPPPPPPPMPEAPPPTGTRASPAARRRAAERGIDLEMVHGTGPGGSIRLEDLEGAPSRRGIDFVEMRKAIAAAMARSKREIPHYYLAHEIDMRAATAWLGETNAGRPPEGRLLMAALLVKATSLALRHFGEFNGTFENGAFRPSEAVHCGVAIAIRGGGLIAPAIHHSDTLSLDDLMAAMRDLVGRVRSGRLRSSEITDSTITLSSLGDRGVESLYAVIYPPQVAIVGFGSLTGRPLAIAGKIEAVPAITATLAADHRVSDGHRGALFLRAVDDLLQEPEAL